jgi:hypothetical protein
VLALTLILLQVSVRPTTVVPAQHERYAVQVANPSEAAIIAVRVAVPAAITVLGVEAPPAWTAHLEPPTDTAPQAIEWDGGALGQREFREFAFLGRLPADARRATLVLPVLVRFADGTAREWRAEVAIRGSVGVTPGGAFVLAAGVFGVAVLAIALALRRPR